MCVDGLDCVFGSQTRSCLLPYLIIDIADYDGRSAGGQMVCDGQTYAAATTGDNSCSVFENHFVPRLV